MLGLRVLPDRERAVKHVHRSYDQGMTTALAAGPFPLPRLVSELAEDAGQLGAAGQAEAAED